MSILISTVVNIIFIFFSAYQSDASPEIVCAYKTINANPDEFDVTTVPKRCQVVIFGNRDLGIESLHYNDKGIIIKKLIEAGRTVYVEVSAENVPWYDVLTDTTGTYLSTIQGFLSDNISGVVLHSMDIFDENTKITPTLINNFISGIHRVAGSEFKVCMHIDGFKSANYSQLNQYQFDIMNDQVDQYIIDTIAAQFACGQWALQHGRFPIRKADIQNVVTLEHISEAVNNSKMDSDKLIVTVHTYIPGTNTNTLSNVQTLTSYGVYCTGSKKNKLTAGILWCPDNSSRFNAEVQFLKGHYKGITILYINFDDTNNDCDCGINPVAETYIKSWYNEEVGTCQALE